MDIYTKLNAYTHDCNVEYKLLCKNIRDIIMLYKLVSSYGLRSVCVAPWKKAYCYPAAWTRWGKRAYIFERNDRRFPLQVTRL